MSETSVGNITVAEWPHLYVKGEPDAPVLIALHGTGGTEHDGVALASQLASRATVIAPRGRVTEQGMNRWFRRLGEGVFDVDDVERRADELAEFVSSAVAEYALEARMLVAAGFSNGANMALATAIRHPGLVAQAIAFSGMYPFADRTPAGPLGGLQLLLLNGHDDPMAPRASVDRLQSVVTALGAQATREGRAGGHGITAGELATAREWLADRT